MHDLHNVEILNILLTYLQAVGTKRLLKHGKRGLDTVIKAKEEKCTK
jgi:hypothetical protein